MKVGIGYANEIDGLSSGMKVAETAIKNGKIEKPEIVIAFCSGHVDHGEYFKGIQTVIGEKVPIVGGSAVGIITNKNLSYEGFPTGAAIIESENIKSKVAAVGGLDKDEKSAGLRLAEKLSTEAAGKLLLIFYDSIKKIPAETAPPIINASPPLLEGIEDMLNVKVPVLGGGVVGDFEFNPTKQFCGSYVDSQSVVGLLLDGDFKPYFRIMHGCIPKDGIYYRVTGVEGSVLYELDGRPVAEIIDEQYGNDEWRKQFPVNRLAVAINHGNKFDDFKESNFVNRLIGGALPDGKGVSLFEPDLREGDEILFMLRNGTIMTDSVRENSSALFDEIIANGERPVFGLYIDCAGRTSLISDTLNEEASEVQRICNQYDVPLIGFYSGVEIAPLLGRSRGLDWTGVLLILTEN